MGLTALLLTLLSMNYAEDRLDRRARHDIIGDEEIISDNNGLWKDFVTAQQQSLMDHELLGRTLRDVGWIRHAVYHNGQAWMNDPTSFKAAGDYAQMAEFAGFPEVGMMALLHYRRKGSLKPIEGPSNNTSEFQSILSSPEWLQQEAPDGDCGCGSRECGRYRCFVPMVDMNETLDALHEYTAMAESRATSMPDAHQILTMIAKDKCRSSISKQIPALLRFWETEETNNNDLRALQPVLQLLLTKLLYLTIPLLATEAVAQLVDFNNTSRQQLADDFKSHWAYFVLIRAVVLGERIKPHRRISLRPAYHVPVWDVVWNKDGRIYEGNKNYSRQSPNVLNSINQLRACLKAAASTEQSEMSLLWWNLPTHLNASSNIYLAGDSHVLSTAWQSIVLPSGEERLIVPVVVTGIKAWHTRAETRFFTHATLQTLLKRIRQHHDDGKNRNAATTITIMFSAGEIDCREGIGGKLLEGYSEGAVSENYIQRTVEEYVKAFQNISNEHELRIFVLPVAPHAYRSERNGKSVGRAARRKVMQIWNSELRRNLNQKQHTKVLLLDYEEELIDPGYVLKAAYNADNTHMNSAFLPCLEKAIKECGCDEL